LPIVKTTALAAAFAIAVLAQPPAPRPARPTVFPVHPQADAATLARGKAIYGVNCNFCHGSDARGGEGGPNLLRSDLVLNDVRGELIGPVVLNGRGEMPKIPLTQTQIGDVADYLHDFKVGGYDISRMTPPSIVVGDAKAGEAYFQKVCSSCHSTTGDMKSIAAKYSDPKGLQNAFVAGGGGRGGRVSPATVTVTEANGTKVEGRLIRIDDFTVTLAAPDNTQRTFRRDGDSPKVDLHDPLQPHKELLPKYTDSDIHNLTAFLVTLK
jgi:cytochrome c oxidase cbb3-type subunit III